MDVERREDSHYIIPSEQEDPRAILRAIAIASFELARPAGMGRLNFDGSSTFTLEQADQFIIDGKDGLCLDMDYIEGRQVKTFITTEPDGSLAFKSWLFERDRGNPEPMFERTREILESTHSSAALPAEIVSTQHQFIGESLTLKLKELGYSRNAGESDEQFRKRVFPTLFSREVILAGEFVFGRHETDWTDSERTSYIELIGENPNVNLLQEFANKTIKETFRESQ